MLLERVVNMIRLDPSGDWLDALEMYQARALDLRSGDPGRQDLVMFSASIMSIYGGMGSFSDWGPGIWDPSTGRVTKIPGTEGFSQAASELHAAAFALRDPKPIE